MTERTRDLDLDLLRAFVAVADHGGFSRAATRLNRTQPAVSQQIGRLEARLGRALFSRDGRGAGLTLDGAALLPQARRLLRMNDDIVAGLAQADVEGEVRFGAPEDITTQHLPEILGAFARSHPRIRLTVTCDYTANLLDQMSRGQLDLALIKREPLGPDMGVRVWSEPLVWAAWPGAVEPDAEILPLILAPPPDIYRKRALAALQAAGRSFRHAFTSPSVAGQLAALRAGLGVGVLPAAMAPADLEILREGLPALPDSEIALVTARDSASGPARLLAQEVLHALERGR